MRVLVLHPVSGTVDGVNLSTLTAGHFYELPSTVGQHLIEKEAGFEVPPPAEAREFEGGPATGRLPQAVVHDGERPSSTRKNPS